MNRVESTVKDLNRLASGRQPKQRPRDSPRLWQNRSREMITVIR